MENCSGPKKETTRLIESPAILEMAFECHSHFISVLLISRNLNDAQISSAFTNVLEGVVKCLEGLNYKYLQF
jgi:hypothetical protein